LSDRAIARARGYGIIEMPDGRFRARINFPPGNDGKRKQRTRILPTELEAEQWSRTILVATVEGTHIERSSDTFNAMADEWLLNRESEEVRPITLRSYRSALKPSRTAFGHKPVQSVTPTDIRALMRKLSGRARGTNQITLYV
jgi:hypothetical protein